MPVQIESDSAPLWSPEMLPAVGPRVWFRADADGLQFRLCEVVALKSNEAAVLTPVEENENFRGNKEQQNQLSDSSDLSSSGPNSGSSSNAKVKPPALTFTVPLITNPNDKICRFRSQDVFPKNVRATVIDNAMNLMPGFESGGVLSAYLGAKIFDRSCSGLIFHKVF